MPKLIHGLVLERRARAERDEHVPGVGRILFSRPDQTLRGTRVRRRAAELGAVGRLLSVPRVKDRAELREVRRRECC